MNAQRGNDVCVVHLVWAPLGLEPFRRFLASYREYPSGAVHRLLIVYNGFKRGEDRGAYRGELDGLPHEELLLVDPMQDVQAYFLAAAAVTEPRICFLNSYSVILAPLWLQKLLDGLDRPNMGAVGATGSAQSHSTYLRTRGWPPARARWLQPLKDIRYGLELLRLCVEFAPFPNHHLRTNAFIANREIFLEMSRPIHSKRAAERFESGRRGLTAQLLVRGLQVGIVDRHGICHLPAAWSSSRTFRSGAQENLLVADNRTAEYDAADPALKGRMAYWAWGAATP